MGQYSPSVLPTDDEQTVLDLNEPASPSISGLHVVPPGVSNQYQVVPLAGFPPDLTVLQAHQKRHADAKQSITTIEGAQTGGPHL